MNFAYIRGRFEGADNEKKLNYFKNVRVWDNYIVDTLRHDAAELPEIHDH